LVARSRVLKAAEAAKKHLSYHPFARVEEEFIAESEGQPLHLDMEISREEFEELIQPLLARTMDCVQRALDDAKLAASAIDKVVLVGGSTRTPRIGQLLESRLGQPAHQEVNPDLCVAMGAAVQGAIIGGANVGAVLVDITPHSLGIIADDMGMPFLHHFAAIIKRNSSLPASQSEVFSTYHDNQTQVEIEIYQGEDNDVRRNHRIGRFMIEGLSRVPAGNPLLVQLDLNLDGVLRVSARERATGLSKQVTIENALARFQREERSLAQDRLNRLWADQEEESEEGPEEEVTSQPSLGAAPELPSLVAVPAEEHRQTVQARALLEKAQRLLEKVSSEDRAEVERMIARVQSALTEQKWNEVTTGCNELADTLFYLEDA
jgi:molecular chaperone DnaK